MADDTRFVRGAQKLSRRIQTLRENLALPDLTQEIADLLERRILDRFDREVDPDGNPWIPLALQSLKRKKRAGYGDRPILVKEGSLRRAIHQIKGGAGTVFTNTGAGIRIGIDDPDVVPYARVQNDGLASKNIPARRFLGIGQLDVRAVDGLMRRKGAKLQQVINQG